MWFQFPKGVESMSCQLQSFASEVVDDDGNHYFRAPNHFAPLILDLPGFVAKEPPETDLADLPQPDPLRDGAIENLSKELQGTKGQLSEANEALTALQASYTALKTERDDLQSKLDRCEALNRELEEQIDDSPLAVTPPVVAGKRR